MHVILSFFIIWYRLLMQYVGGVDKLRVNVLSVILAKDDWIFTFALPTNSQVMLVDSVFVHFDDALREDKVTIIVLIRDLEGSMLGVFSGAIGRTSAYAEVVVALTFIHAICLVNIYQFQMINFISDCYSLVQLVISTHDNLFVMVIL